MSDLISIIVPCYNGEAYIRRAVGAALDQRDVDVEVVVVDDGSTDDSAAVADKVGDGRVRVIRQENRGLSAARNRGISEARGDLLLFLDADDLIFPDACQQLIQVIAETGADIAVGRSWRVLDGPEPRLVYINSWRVPREPLADLLICHRFPVNAAMVTRGAIERSGTFEESLRGAEDWDLFVRILLDGGTMTGTEALVADYRLLPGSMSSHPRRQIDAMLQVIDRLYAHPKLPAELAALKPKARAETHMNGVVKALHAGEPALAGEYLQLALGEGLDEAIVRRRVLGKLIYGRRAVETPEQDYARAVAGLLGAVKEADVYRRLLRDNVSWARDRGETMEALRAMWKFLRTKAD